MVRITFKQKNIHETVLFANDVSQHIPNSSIGICSYVPGLSDHRGVCLYIWSKQNDVSLEEMSFEQDRQLLTQLYNYMRNPIHVKKYITDRFKKKVK